MSMNLVKLKNNTYGVRFSRQEKPPHGGIVSLRSIVGHPVTTKEEANQILVSLKKNFHQHKLQALDGSRRITLDEFITDYTTGERGDLSPKTLAMDRLALKTLADSCGHQRAIKAITKQDMVKLKSDLLARNVSPATAATYFRHIRAAFTWALKNNYRSTPVEMPAIKQKKQLPKTIPTPAMDTILAWTLEHDFEIWRYTLAAVETGCRQDELVKLTWETVTLFDGPDANGLMGHAVVTGKGDKERTVYLTRRAAAAIGPRKEVGRVFHPWTGSTVSHYFKRAARMAGFPDCHFHMLRHTAGSRMVEAGMNIRVIQTILGHVDISTTLRYTHVTDMAAQAEMGKMVR